MYRRLNQCAIWTWSRISPSLYCVILCILMVQALSLLLTFALNKGGAATGMQSGHSLTHALSNAQLFQSEYAATNNQTMARYLRSYQSTINVISSSSDLPPLPLEERKDIALSMKNSANLSIGSFLKIYEEYCNRSYTFKNITLPLCPCVPPGLGKIIVFEPS